MTVYQRHKLGEVTGILLFAVSLLLIFSLYSYHPFDASYNVSSPQSEVANYAGRVGAWTADLLLQIFGVAAFLLPFPLLILGARRLRGRAIETPFLKGLMFLFCLLSVATGAALLQDSLPDLDFEPGGAVGMLLSQALLRRLNVPGSLVVVSAVLIISLILTTRFSVDRILSLLLDREWNVLGGIYHRWEHWRQRRRHRKELAGLQNQDRTVVAAPPRTPVPEVLPVQSRQVVTLEPESAGGEAEPPATRSQSQAPPAVVPRPQPSEPLLESFEINELPPAQRPYQTPPLEFLKVPQEEDQVDERELIERAQQLATKCAEFDVHGQVLQIHPGPVVTTFEFKPDPGVKYSRITSLEDDLCLALRAESIRIDRMPGKNTVGIEVPNLNRQVIYLREILSASAFQQSTSVLTLALGKLINGNTYVADLSRMPHLLIAGATGAGKSVALNCLVCSILYKASPEQVRFIMIDPKRLELGVYENIPHLLTPIVTDPKKASNALNWAVREMEDRYRLLAQHGVRNIEQYNRRVQKETFEVEGQPAGPLPYIVVIVDELADLMMTTGKEVEAALTRLAQMARAIGIHLILATQRPSVDVLTGLIKANFPSRISFRVSSKVDSRTILDTNGSEQLLGQGDMLFLSPGTSRLIRIHGAFIDEREIARITQFLKEQAGPEYLEGILEGEETQDSSLLDVSDMHDDLYQEAARFVVETGKASTSLLQRRLRVGYGRAARLLDMMEHEGIVGPPDGSRPREVLVPPDYFDEIDRSDE